MSSAHDRVVCLLSSCLALRHCPMVPHLAMVLLHHTNEAETFAIIKSLYRKGGLGVAGVSSVDTGAGGAGSTLRMFLTTQQEEAAFVETFIVSGAARKDACDPALSPLPRQGMVKNHFPKLHGHIAALIKAGHHSVSQCFLSWFRGFFTGWLPHADVVRIVDLYLAEGSKVLLRVGLGWLKARKRKAFALKRIAKADIQRAMAAYLEAAKDTAPAKMEAQWQCPLLLRPSALLGGAGGGTEAALKPLYQPPPPSTSRTSALVTPTWESRLTLLAPEFPPHTPSQLAQWLSDQPGIPPSSPAAPLAVGPSRCLALLPSATALHATFPAKFKASHLLPVYSSASHVNSLQTLYAHTHGMAPVVLLLQVAVAVPVMPLPAAAAATEPAATEAPQTLSVQFTLAVLSTAGLQAPGQAMPGSGSWTGSLADVVFQLQPEIARFSTMSSVGQRPQLGSACLGTPHKQRFTKERFLWCSDSALVLGGAGVGEADAPALTLSQDLERCRISGRWLADLGLLAGTAPAPDQPARLPSEVSGTVGGVEALALVHASGGMETLPAHKAAKAAGNAAKALALAARAYAEAAAVQGE
ncbi:unnamed protein product [Symbiodinium sp. KB8]|nr:unnamed protein product [Symbiodinium sp. KB8]